MDPFYRKASWSAHAHPISKWRPVQITFARGVSFESFPIPYYWNLDTSKTGRKEDATKFWKGRKEVTVTFCTVQLHRLGSTMTHFTHLQMAPRDDITSSNFYEDCNKLNEKTPLCLALCLFKSVSWANSLWDDISFLLKTVPGHTQSHSHLSGVPLVISVAVLKQSLTTKALRISEFGELSISTLRQAKSPPETNKIHCPSFTECWDQNWTRIPLPGSTSRSWNFHVCQDLPDEVSHPVSMKQDLYVSSPALKKQDLYLLF